MTRLIDVMLVGGPAKGEIVAIAPTIGEHIVPVDCPIANSHRIRGCRFERTGVADTLVGLPLFGFAGKASA